MTLPRLGGGFLLDHVTLEVRAGEILGLYGLMGAGRTELMEVLAGVRPEASGEVWLGDRRLDRASVAERIEAGIVLVPEDRKTGRPGPDPLGGTQHGPGEPEALPHPVLPVARLASAAPWTR